MIQLVNKQIHILIFVKNLHKKRKDSKHTRCLKKIKEYHNVLPKEKKNSDSELSKRRKCSIQGRPNII